MVCGMWLVYVRCVAGLCGVSGVWYVAGLCEWCVAGLCVVVCVVCGWFMWCEWCVAGFCVVV